MYLCLKKRLKDCWNGLGGPDWVLSTFKILTPVSIQRVWINISVALQCLHSVTPPPPLPPSLWRHRRVTEMSIKNLCMETGVGILKIHAPVRMCSFPKMMKFSTKSYQFQCKTTKSQLHACQATLSISDERLFLPRRCSHQTRWWWLNL